MIDTQYYFLGFLCFLSLPFLIISFFNKTSKPTNSLCLPPSPPGLPIIGHLHHLLGASLCKSLQNLSTQYGPLLYLRLAAARCLVVSSASMATEIFKTHDFAFASRPSFAFADELPLGNLGLFTSPYGDYWKFMKKLCMTELLSTKQLERSHGIRHEEMVQFLHVVLEKANKKEMVDVGNELMKLTNNIICRMLMSTRCSEKGDEADRITELVKESFAVCSKMCFGDALGPLKRLAFWLYGRQAMDLTMRYDEIL
jgi:cytochrome P450